MNRYQLNIPVKLWQTMIADLKARGMGKRESGAFLLGPVGSKAITEYICYDDLDPHCLDTGIIEFDHIGFSKLWPYCIEKQLRVFADAHTHPPGSSTRQSGLDIDNPMIVEKGHIAFIVPNYARNTPQHMQGVGVYEYLGNKKWQTQTLNPDFINLIKETSYGNIITRYGKQIIAYFSRKRWA